MLFSNVVAILALTASAYAQNGTSAAAPASSAASSSSSSSVAPSSVASAAPSSASASSNFTLPAGATTASWPAGLVLQSSVPYTMPPALNVATLGQAAIDYRLANMSESYRQSLCDRQTQWCTTAGCVEAGATINDNFCDVNNLATRCTCNKGDSALSQYQWPVQMADCQNRASACTQSCWDPATTSIENRQSCLSTCSSTLRDSCSTPGQVAANYAVSKRGQTPSYTIVQGGTASGATAMRTGGGVALVITVAAAAVMVVA